MSPEPIGFLTLIVGIVCVMLGQGAVLIGLCVFALLGAAAALFVGSANIQPGHLFMCFVAISTLAHRQTAAASLKALRPPEPGFWLLCLLTYGVVAAAFVPRIWSGITFIVPLGTTQFDETGSTVPLVPVSSNFNQSVYLASGLICFLCVSAIASSVRGFRQVLMAVFAYGVGNCVLAAVDLATYLTGTQSALGIIRNAQYALHTDSAISGFKRIVGSFTEASSFARTTLGMIAVSGTLYLCRRHTALTGSLTAASIVFALLSTSSTGLGGFPIVMVLLMVTALGRSGVRPSAHNASAVLLAVPVFAVVLAGLLVSDQALFTVIREYVELVVINKGSSNSGLERSGWNESGLRNFAETAGFGVGLGTVRTSSLAVALLAQVGVIGTLFYITFCATSFLLPRGEPRSYHRDVRVAARNGCLGLIVGDLVASPTIDQGLFFYLLAALSASAPEVRRSIDNVIPGGVRA